MTATQYFAHDYKPFQQTSIIFFCEHMTTPAYVINNPVVHRNPFITFWDILHTDADILLQKLHLLGGGNKVMARMRAEMEPGQDFWPVTRPGQ